MNLLSQIVLMFVANRDSIKVEGHKITYYATSEIVKSKKKTLINIYFNDNEHMIEMWVEGYNLREVPILLKLFFKVDKPSDHIEETVGLIKNSGFGISFSLEGWFSIFENYFEMQGVELVSNLVKDLKFGRIGETAIVLFDYKDKSIITLNPEKEIINLYFGA